MSEKQPYATTNEVAAHFGISVSTFRVWLRTGRIPPDTYIKIGTTYRFKLADIEKALTGHVNSNPDEAKKGIHEQIEMDFDGTDEPEKPLMNLDFKD